MISFVFTGFLVKKGSPPRPPVSVYVRPICEACNLNIYVSTEIYPHTTDGDSRTTKGRAWITWLNRPEYTSHAPGVTDLKWALRAQ